MKTRNHGHTRRRGTLGGTKRVSSRQRFFAICYYNSGRTTVGSAALIQGAAARTPRTAASTQQEKQRWPWRSRAGILCQCTTSRPSQREGQGRRLLSLSRLHDPDPHGRHRGRNHHALHLHALHLHHDHRDSHSCHRADGPQSAGDTRLRLHQPGLRCHLGQRHRQLRRPPARSRRCLFRGRAC